MKNHSSACIWLALLLALALLSSVSVDAATQGKPLPDTVERAATLIHANRIEEAERLLTSALKARPNDAAALDLLGTIRAKQGRLSDAEELFIRAVGIDNQLIGAHLNLAYLYLLKSAPDKAAAELREALRLDPKNPDASYRLAWLLLAQSRVDDCIALSEQAKQAGALSAQLLAVLGDAYLKKGAVEKAEENYLLGLKEQAGNADVLIGLALVSQAKGNAREAMAYLNRAKGAVGRSPDLLFKFAEAALSTDSAGDAIGALKQAIKVRPDEPPYHLALGIAWLRVPDVREAELAFRQFLKLQPDSDQGQMYLGYTLLKQKNYPEARAWLEKSLQKSPGTPETFYYLGLIAQEQNEDERAIELFEKAIHLAPSFAHPHIALGSVYLKLKNYSRSQEELETGVRLSPDDTKAHYNLALLYARLKDSKRAQEEMRIVERLKSSGSTAKEADTVAPPPPRPR